MNSDEIYTNLIDIGLKKYLEGYFFNQEWQPEPYLQKIDFFIARLDNRQKDILRRKFQPLTDHISINDHLYELMIAIAFHAKGKFKDNTSAGMSPDIVDNGVNIEVKSINAEPNEIERIKNIVPNTVSQSNFPEDTDFKERFQKKFSFRAEKAKQQINNKGIIYIVWDTSLKGSKERRFSIQKLLEYLCEKEKSVSPKVNIKTIYFEDLRELVAKS